MAFFFYGLKGVPDHCPPALGLDFAIETWRPSLINCRPLGFKLMPYAVWWLFWLFRVFRDKGYAIYIIREKQTGRAVHRSHVFPRWFRFPFMEPGDLQIGDTYTEPDHRGKKLAEVALAKIASDLAQEGRTLWYVVHEDNAPSIRVAEKCGFQRLGAGERRKRCGVGILGAYRIESP